MSVSSASGISGLFSAKIFGRALVFLLLMSAITVLYTLLVTTAGKALFPFQADGSLFEAGGRRYSALLGQPFSAPNHLWGRPMLPDTATYARDGRPLLYAGPSNKSPATEEYAASVAERAAKIRAAHPDKGDAPVPVDLVSVSGSGLDPHISPAAADYQVQRLAGATGFTPEEVRRTIAMYTEGRSLGVFGEPRVHVLKVNLALEGMLPNARNTSMSGR